MLVCELQVLCIRGQISLMVAALAFLNHSSTFASPSIRRCDVIAWAREENTNTNDLKKHDLKRWAFVISKCCGRIKDECCINYIIHTCIVMHCINRLLSPPSTASSLHVY